jgi:cytochrome c oxidase subunit 2
MDSFDPVTPQGLVISNLFWLVLAISGLLFGVVVVWLVVALARFRVRAGDATEPAQVYGNPTAEFLWTAIPAVTAGVVFVLVIFTMRTVDAAAPNAQPLRIVGHQWWWEYSYPDLQVTSANELHVPIGTPLQASLESIDVIHSFRVPQFGWMRDAVPGRTNQMSILVDRPGTYAGTCNQYCGLQHAWMRIIVIAESPETFNAWAQQQRRAVAPSGSRGEQVFLQNTCVNCHTIRGIASQAAIGPDLTHLGSRATLGTGVATNDPSSLRAWIRNASAMKPGVLMPPFQNISTSDLDALADYLESLK